MKIKTVCELTDLSDRAVRHYIQEGLIAPAYSESYLGRRSFDFTDADVRMLKDVAVLRKFGFSIPEIKQLQDNPNESGAIIETLCARKRAIVETEQTMLTALSKLEAGKSYTVAELAEMLAASSDENVLPAEDARRDWKQWWHTLFKSIIVAVIVWLPIAAAVFGVIDSLRIYLYPQFNTIALIITLVTLIPSIAVLLMRKLRHIQQDLRKLRAVLLVICALSVPINLLFSFTIFNRSETTDIANYRRVDAYCPASNDEFYHALFPKRAFSSSMVPPVLDSHFDAPRYYYRFYIYFDETYDIYAQWTLGEDEFNAEVSRVKQLFESDEANAKSDRYKYETIQKGAYTCLFKYDYLTPESAPPFDGEAVRDHYVYYGFAYDKDTRTVRYFTCYSMDASTPYYLTLDW